MQNIVAKALFVGPLITPPRLIGEGINVDIVLALAKSGILNDICN